MPVSDTVARDGADAEGDHFPISELFASPQGEGKLAGALSTFARISGCNLRCWFCDSLHTSWESTHAWPSLDEIVAEVESLSLEHAVVTDGEPLVHDETDALLSALDDDYHLTVETNGTLEIDAPVDLASISSKLASLVPTPNNAPDDVDLGVWTEWHENACVDLGALASLVEDTAESQLKLVVTSRDDLDEIESLADNVRGVADREIHDSDVLLIPEGQTREQLARTRTEVADLAASFGYRCTPRLHVGLWNDALEIWTPAKRTSNPVKPRRTPAKRAPNMPQAHPERSTIVMTTEPTSDDKRAVVLLSGGMDSATTAHEAMWRGYELYALHTPHGQEIESEEYDRARELADKLDAWDFFHIETSHLKQVGASSLTDNSMAVADADVDADDAPTSYVPFRNANFLSMAVSYAEANDCDAVFVGAHFEDYSGYPDCRPEFLDAFEAMVDVGTKPDTTISLEVPFVHDSKTDIIRRGLELGVPFEYTWSCYRAEGPARGTCDPRAFHLQAFQNLGERDPIPYAECPDHADGDTDPDAA